MQADPVATLSDTFRQMHDKLSCDGDVVAARQRLVDLAGAAIPECDWAAITVWPRRRKPLTVASTGEVSRTVDRIQYDTEQGPCLSAAVDNTTSWIPDFRTDHQWPRFTSEASRQTPVRGALSFHLTSEPERAALNLYTGRPGAFDQAAVDTGALFAIHAGMLMAHTDSAQQAADLKQALGASRQIGAAIGILMAAHGVPEETAFAMLRAVSNRLNRKLRDIAAEVTDSRRLPV